MVARLHGRGEPTVSGHQWIGGNDGKWCAKCGLGFFPPVPFDAPETECLADAHDAERASVRVEAGISQRLD